MDYPLPTAEAPEVERVQALYRTRYHLELSHDEAKRLLEGVMQFIYLTEVEPQIRKEFQPETEEIEPQIKEIEPKD